ncbi:hypothetical protein MPL3356_10039 [Mesorhizobium plurifarium]|uniref:Uncharacterized protein n=1 Tax=Mesorhizobium plurifarium TaxID=69974 RepID=A0A090DDK4_MESPL|nr:hypothetical protein MPL3356_10039 [Mesorhizobium plurifarium]
MAASHTRSAWPSPVCETLSSYERHRQGKSDGHCEEDLITNAFNSHSAGETCVRGA